MEIKELRAMTDEQRTVVEKNYNLIHHVLKKFTFPKDKYEDYEQIGALALCKAAILFDESKGFKFTTFAVSYIKFSLLTYFRTYEMSIIKLPLKIYQDTIAGKKENIRYDSYEGFLESQTTNWEPYHEQSESQRNFDEEVIDDLYIKNVLSTLTKEESEMFDYLLEGYSQSDIAKIYKCSRANINIKIQAIRKKLKLILKEEPSEIDLGDQDSNERI